MSQKWNLQDIRPAVPQKQALRESPRRQVARDIAPRKLKQEEPDYLNDPDLATIDVIDGSRVKRKRVIVTAVFALIIIGIGFFVNVLLGGAEITVYPKMKDISVQATFEAFKTPKVGELGYELLSLETTGEKQVKANGKEAVSIRAEGIIFIYNTKSTSEQRLVKNTRFETKDGLIFKIKESVVVPGASKDAKGNLVPGSASAEVFADGTGEKYNIAPTRFTVPGLKGSDQYVNVYGESTSAFTGGFEGEKYIIDEAELDTAKQALHVELRDTLLARLKEERPAGFVIYDGAITFTYESLPSTEYGASLATIKEKVTMHVPMFMEPQFAEYIADKSIPEYAAEPVTFLNPNTLTFTYENASTSVSDISTLESFEMTLKGGSTIVWKFDEQNLKKQLLGLKKAKATEVFSTYGGIRTAQAVIRPFWATTYPEDVDNIIVNTILEQKTE